MATLFKTVIQLQRVWCVWSRGNAFSFKQNFPLWSVICLSDFDSHPSVHKVDKGLLLKIHSWFSKSEWRWMPCPPFSRLTADTFGLMGESSGNMCCGCFNELSLEYGTWLDFLKVVWPMVSEVRPLLSFFCFFFSLWAAMITSRLRRSWLARAVALLTLWDIAVLVLLLSCRFFSKYSFCNFVSCLSLRRLLEKMKKMSNLQKDNILGVEEVKYKIHFGSFVPSFVFLIILKASSLSHDSDPPENSNWFI